jgi:starch synthase
MIDLVFCDSQDISSALHDNNYGRDYHIPIVGAVGRLPPLKVVHISVEMAPIAKVGGMGDVVTALGRAVQEYGHQVEVRLSSALPAHLLACRVWGALQHLVPVGE